MALFNSEYSAVSFTGFSKNQYASRSRITESAFSTLPKPVRTMAGSSFSPPPERAHQFESVQPGHHQVRDDYVGRPGIEFLESLLSIVRSCCVESLAGEGTSEVAPHVRLVVDNQHPPWCEEAEIYWLRHLSFLSSSLQSLGDSPNGPPSPCRYIRRGLDPTDRYVGSSLEFR